MKANSNIILERLKENVNNQSGCSVIYLKSLKSDLNRLLKQYMALSDIDITLIENNGGYQMSITVIASEFFDIGRGE